MPQDLVLALGLAPNDLSADAAGQLLQSCGLLGRFARQSLAPGLWAFGFESTRAEYAWAEDQNKTASLEWMGPRIMSFDTAMRAVGRFQVLWPFGFPCLFSSWDQLTLRVRQHEEQVLNFFQRYHNQQEYNLLIQQKSRPAVSEPARSSASGLDYLRQRQAETRRLADLQTVQDDFTKGLKQLFDQKNIEWQERAVSSILAHEKIALHMVLAAGQEEIQKLEPEIALLAAPHDIKFTLSGPWPLMSFISRLEEPRPRKESPWMTS